MPKREKFVEYEGDLDSKIYGVAYKMGIDNNNPDLTVVMLAFQLGYNIKKFSENVMLAKVFRRFADELEGTITLTKSQEEAFKQWSLPLTYEDEEENNDPTTTM